MTEDLKTYLTRRAEAIDAYLTELPARAESARRFLVVYPVELDRAERDRAEVLQALATLFGPAAALAPRDITTSPDRLGLGVAGLSISPGEHPSIEDVRLYAGTMRALYEQATSQARQAADMVRALEHREQQAVTQTGTFAAVPPAAEQGVTVESIQQGVTYLDRYAYAWVWEGWEGETSVGDDGHPLMSKGYGDRVRAEWLITERGPLCEAPEVVVPAQPATAAPAEASVGSPPPYEAPEPVPATTLPDEAPQESDHV